MFVTYVLNCCHWSFVEGGEGARIKICVLIWDKDIDQAKNGPILSCEIVPVNEYLLMQFSYLGENERNISKAANNR